MGPAEFEPATNRLCCRYGGEELAVILPLTEIDEARAIAERLRSSLTERLPDGGSVTLSIGVATCGKKTGTGERLVELADAALYRAKRFGKNQVWVAGDAPARPLGPDRAEPGR